MSNGEDQVMRRGGSLNLRSSPTWNSQKVADTGACTTISLPAAFKVCAPLQTTSITVAYLAWTDVGIPEEAGSSRSRYRKVSAW
ncbi:hypothetical protein ACN47E_006078 [Coniothyrium glycines]